MSITDSQSNTPKQDQTKTQHNKVTIIGIGGTGLEILNSLPIPSKNKIAVDTDLDTLSTCDTNEKELIGKLLLRGSGTGSDPLLGRTAALEDRSELQRRIPKQNIVIVITSLGGGTGTGAASVICNQVKENNSLCIGILLLPAFSNNEKKQRNASVYLNKIIETTDAAFVIRTDKLFSASGKSVQELQDLVSDYFHKIVIDLYELISQISQKDNSYSPRDLFKNTGRLALGLAETDGVYDPVEMLNQAFKNPLSELSNNSTKAIWAHISAGNDLSYDHAESIASDIRKKLEPKQRFFWSYSNKHVSTSQIRILFLETNNLIPPAAQQEDKSAQQNKSLELDKLKKSLQLREPVLIESVSNRNCDLQNPKAADGISPENVQDETVSLEVDPYFYSLIEK